MLGELVRESGGSALIVSHDAAATSIADRIVVVRDGRVVEEARPGRPRSLVVAHGWVRLPESVLRETGRPGLVAAEALNGRIVLEPEAGSQRAPEQPASPGCGGRSALRRGRAAQGRQELRRTGRARRSQSRARGGCAHGARRTLRERQDDPAASAGGPRAPVGGSGRPWPERSWPASAARSSPRYAAVTSRWSRRSPGLISYLTALENVRLALSLRGDRPRSRLRARRSSRSDWSSGSTRRSVGSRPASVSAWPSHVRLPRTSSCCWSTSRPPAWTRRTPAWCSVLLARAAHERGLAVVCATHDPVLIEAADNVVQVYSGQGSGLDL